MAFSKRLSPASQVLRHAVPAALCSAGLAAAALAAPVASAHAGTPVVQAAPVPGVIRGAPPVGSAQKQRDKQALGYWTRARLRTAKPAGVIIARKAPPVAPPAAFHPGKPGRAAAGLPSGHGPATARPVPRISQEAPGYPFPYDSFTVPQSLWSTYPYSVNGKLFFTNGGSNYVCSATAVASASGTSNENEIWTAGSCLVNIESNDQVVDSSAVFIPAYDGNVSNYAPFGLFVWNGAYTTTTAWLNNRDFTEDEAAMWVGPSSTTGRSLGSSVGWDGFVWNQPVYQSFVAFGYPAESPYNGLDMVEDIADTAGQDTIGGANSVEPIVIGDPMTNGAGGGAWNIDWTPSGPGYLDGHNDYRYPDQPLAMYSPYQDSLSNSVRCYGAASC